MFSCIPYYFGMKKTNHTLFFYPTCNSSPVEVHSTLLGSCHSEELSTVILFCWTSANLTYYNFMGSCSQPHLHMTCNN